MKIGWELYKENGIYFSIDELAHESVSREDLDILYVLQGNVRVFKAQEQLSLHAEDLTVFNPYELRSFYCETGSHTISAHIALEQIIGCKVGWLSVNSAVQSDKTDYLQVIRKKLALICKYILSGEKQTLYIKSELLGILAILNSEFRDDGNIRRAEAVQRGKLKRPGLISEITQYLFEHYTEPCSLSEVAAHFYVSKSYLSRLFVEKTGINFSDYLNKIRMMHARAMLLTSWASVTEISLACGFGNVNTFIANFRKDEGMAPAAFRKENREKGPAGSHLPSVPARMDAYTGTQLFTLLKHTTKEDDTALATAANQNRMAVFADLDKKKTGSAHWNKAELALHMGYASGFFSSLFEATGRMMVKAIPYRFLFLCGIFDDTIDVCRRKSDGSLEFRYAILDRITDYILSLGLLPWYELSRTPAALLEKPEKSYDGGYIQLPADRDEWCLLVRSTLRHFVDRYGADSVSQWRLTVSSSLLASYGVFAMDEYLSYYTETFRAIREVLPSVTVTSGAFDAGLLQLTERAEENDLCLFLKEAKRTKTLPDELAMQCFQVNYQGDAMTETLEKLRRPTRLEGEPATPSPNPDQMAADIQYIENCLQTAGVSMDISVVSWNSSLWYSDLGCDTCYKSAFFIKNYLENASKVCFINHNVFYADEAEGSLFSGGPGAVTAYGIPKALANAMKLIPALGDVCCGAGPGWFVTSNREKTEIQVMLYHYEHYNLELRLDEVLPKEEQLKIDRYAGFENHGSRDVGILLSGLDSGAWKREDLRIDWEHGSSYDVWRNMGSPKELTPALVEKLNHAAETGYYYEELHIDETRNIQLSQILEPFSVRLIQLKKI